MEPVKRLVVLDMDSTFIKEEVIDLLAELAGVGPQVAAITERSMRGELDFKESLAERVALLKGLPEDVCKEVRTKIHLSDGVGEMIYQIHKNHGFVAVVSGGFINVIEPILKDAEVDCYRANTLEVFGGFLTGKVIGPVIDRAAKAEFLRELSSQLDVPLPLTVAVGDGANDLGMMEIAGTSIAFNAKPIVAEYADIVIDDGDLSKVAEFLYN